MLQTVHTVTLLVADSPHFHACHVYVLTYPKELTQGPASDLVATIGGPFVALVCWIDPNIVWKGVRFGAALPASIQSCLTAWACRLGKHGFIVLQTGPEVPGLQVSREHVSKLTRVDPTLT